MFKSKSEFSLIICNSSKTERELLELQENELIEYYNDLNEYYWTNPERAQLQQSIIDESTFSDESESEYDSYSDEDYYSD